MLIGTTLGPYRIDRELGSGGMGRVYAVVVEGRCPGLAPGTRVALKVVHPHLLETPGFFKRFLREGDIGRSVRHSNVVQTFDCDQLLIDGAHHSFLSMEYVEGQTLRELLDELERVPEELCRHIAREVSKGLAAIHAAGVIHRDIKPDNLIISLCDAEPDSRAEYDHVVKIMDLGVARLTGEALRLSQTGAFVGSIHYAAPECFEGDGSHVDARADLHALGLVLYELSTGTNPYFAEKVPQILRKVIHDEPRRLGDLNPQVSAFFEEVVHCLLEKEPEERFASATELLEVLEGGEESRWWRSRAQSIRTTTKRPLRRIRIPRETAVYGRESELATLRSLFDRASEGDGQVLLIEGEAGIGKSRIVDEFVVRLQRDDVPVHFLFGSYPPGGAATASGAWSTAYREHFGDVGSREYLLRTPILVTAFDALLMGETPPAGVEQLTKDSLQTCFVNATRALAEQLPTVVLIDDLHFAPDAGRALLASLAMAVPGHRVLLIGTLRPGAFEEWTAGLTRLDHASHMTLSRLGPKDLVHLLADTLHSSQMADALLRQIAVKSDGNPFFAFEILRGLREGAHLTQAADGSWVSSGVIDEIEIPSSVLDLVGARVAELTEEERDLLDVACCWGFEFDPLTLGDALGIGRIALLKRLGQIERRHRLVRASGRLFVFDHHQVQEALYGSLSVLLREDYHAALAAALEARTRAAERDIDLLDGALCVDLCEHFLKGARGEAAVRYLDRACTHLAQGYGHGDVSALAERALAIPDLLIGATRARVLLTLADALDTLGRRDRQEECALEAERIAVEIGDDALRMAATRALGAVYARTFRQEEAEAAYDRSLAMAVARGDRKAETGARSGLGSAVFSVGRLAEAREHHERSLLLSREIGDRAGEARSTVNLGVIYQTEGRLAEAKEHYSRGLATCREIGHRAFEMTTVRNLGDIFASEGRLSDARAHFERSLELSREIGHRLGEANATGNLGSVFRSEGRLPEARAQYERALAVSREIGERGGEVVALHNLGVVLAEEGDNEQAEARLLESLAESDAIGYRYVSAATHFHLGVLRSSTGEEARASESFVSARDIAAEIGYPGIATLARCHLACLPGGDPSDALAAFAESAELLEAEERQEARWLLFRATGERAHLTEAKRMLDHALAQVDAETRAAIVANLRLPREILAAASAPDGR